jgi:Tsi6
MMAKNKEELRTILEKATARTKEYIVKGPSDIHHSVMTTQILPQLTFIKDCLDHDQVPSSERLSRMNIGVIAAKEFEQSDPDYADWLGALNYGCDHWEDL